MKKYVVYYRVSSAKQGADGLGMEVQKKECLAHVEKNGGTVVGEFIEVASGWKAKARPELQKAIKKAKAAKSVLLCYKLDRMGRKAADMLSMLDDARLNVEIVTLPNFEFMSFGVLAVVAQYESMQISQRTKQAIAVRREKKGDWKRYKETPPDMVELTRKANNAKHEKFLHDNRAAIGKIEECPQCTPTELARKLNERGIETVGGKKFTASLVIQFRRRLNNISTKTNELSTR
jgi:DNA invertase Pin-like site-specific DNA recombinase